MPLAAAMVSLTSWKRSRASTRANPTGEPVRKLSSSRARPASWLSAVMPGVHVGERADQLDHRAVLAEHGHEVGPHVAPLLGWARATAASVVPAGPGAVWRDRTSSRWPRRARRGAPPRASPGRCAVSGILAGEGLPSGRRRPSWTRRGPGGSPPRDVRRWPAGATARLASVEPLPASPSAPETFADRVEQLADRTVACRRAQFQAGQRHRHDRRPRASRNDRCTRVEACGRLRRPGRTRAVTGTAGPSGSQHPAVDGRLELGQHRDRPSVQLGPGLDEDGLGPPEGVGQRERDGVPAAG